MDSVFSKNFGCRKYPYCAVYKTTDSKFAIANGEQRTSRTAGGGQDKKMLQRLELLDKIDYDDRETILKVVDNYLTTAQLQPTHKKLKQKA